MAFGADTCGKSRPARHHRVLRGGSWNNHTEINLRSAYRNNDHPTNRNDNNGFRCVLVVSGGKALQGHMQPRCRAGDRPARPEARKEPKPGGSPPEKTRRGWSWRPAGAGDKTRRPPVVAPPRAITGRRAGWL